MTRSSRTKRPTWKRTSRSRWTQQGLTFEQYLEITGSKEDDLKKTYHAQAEKNIKEFLATEEIAKVEKITISDADVDAEIKKIADQYKMKEEEVRNVLAKNMDQWKDNLRAEEDPRLHPLRLEVSGCSLKTKARLPKGPALAFLTFSTHLLDSAKSPAYNGVSRFLLHS
jgi:beta-lactamase superfamily II metal-dependent hydrolase